MSVDRRLNILTRTWKKFPFPPTSGCPVYSSKLVVTDRSSEAYKVILFCQRELYECDFPLFQIYDSKLDSWSCIILDFKLSYDSYGKVLNSVYFGGVFYVAAKDLFAFNVIQGTFKKLELSFDPYGWEYYHQLVVCKDEALMVITEDRYSASPIALKIDLDSLTLMDGSDAPFLASRTSSRAMAPVGDEDHICFGYSADGGSRMRAYNVKDDLWSASFVPPTCSDDCDYKWIASFQPGFGTFVPV